MLERLKPFSAEDYTIARQSFGPRLVVAMKAVATRAPWGSGEMSALPQDQQEDIRRYLGVTRMLPEGNAGFNQIWGAHPHDYKDDPAQNTTGDEVREEHELPAVFENTCAIRLSIMLNGTGHPITPATAKAAGIARRPHYSSKTGQYYIISALEMWSYLAKHFRGPDAVFPADGRFKNADEFNAAFSSSIAPIVASRKGIVAFESIFGFGGTGHIDLFDGGQLSDSASWYPCRRLQLWYVAV
jgi:hypothetical protein